ncbi:MAG: hypothetical protein Q4A83_03325 [Bacillota bacterium]|nr:hypothetical protein [Bacillota bacterium]
MLYQDNTTSNPIAMATFIIFILGTVLLPMSPGSIIWPSEYIVIAALYILGVILYLRRDNSITVEDQKKMIIGEPKEV